MCVKVVKIEEIDNYRKVTIEGLNRMEHFSGKCWENLIKKSRNDAKHFLIRTRKDASSFEEDRSHARAVLANKSLFDHTYFVSILGMRHPKNHISSTYFEGSFEIEADLAAYYKNIYGLYVLAFDVDDLNSIDFNINNFTHSVIPSGFIFKKIVGNMAIVESSDGEEREIKLKVYAPTGVKYKITSAACKFMPMPELLARNIIMPGEVFYYWMYYSTCPLDTITQLKKHKIQFKLTKTKWQFDQRKDNSLTHTPMTDGYKFRIKLRGKEEEKPICTPTFNLSVTDHSIYYGTILTDNPIRGNYDFRIVVDALKKQARDIKFNIVDMCTDNCEVYTDNKIVLKSNFRLVLDPLKVAAKKIRIIVTQHFDELEPQDLKYNLDKRKIEINKLNNFYNFRLHLLPRSEWDATKKLIELRRISYLNRLKNVEEKRKLKKRQKIRESERQNRQSSYFINHNNCKLDHLFSDRRITSMKIRNKCNSKSSMNRKSISLIQLFTKNIYKEWHTILDIFYTSMNWKRNCRFRTTTTRLFYDPRFADVYFVPRKFISLLKWLSPVDSKNPQFCTMK